MSREIQESYLVQNCATNKKVARQVKNPSKSVGKICIVGLLRQLQG